LEYRVQNQADWSSLVLALGPPLLAVGYSYAKALVARNQSLAARHIQMEPTEGQVFWAKPIRNRPLIPCGTWQFAEMAQQQKRSSGIILAEDWAHPMFRYKRRTLLILMAVGPPAVAGGVDRRGGIREVRESLQDLRAAGS
jgi:hypothetical protein